MKVTETGESACSVWFHIPSGVGEVPEVVVWLPPTRFHRTASPTLIVTVDGENAKSSTNTSTAAPAVEPLVVVVAAVVVVVAAVVDGAVVVAADVVVVVAAVVVVVAPPHETAIRAMAVRSRCVLFIRHSTQTGAVRVRVLISFRVWI